MEPQPRFGTVVMCIDGRVQRPTTRWMQEQYGFDYVDVISEPGPDKLLADGQPGVLLPVREKILLSITAHGSPLVALCGHHGCAGNPASPEEHREQIRQGVRLLRSWDLGADIVGLWLDARWEIEVVEPPLSQA